jgi:hypothetical protein
LAQIEQLRRRGHLGFVAARSGLGEEVQEPAYRDRISSMGIACALLFDIVLARLRQQAGIGPGRYGRLN